MSVACLSTLFSQLTTGSAQFGIKAISEIGHVAAPTTSVASNTQKAAIFSYLGLFFVRSRIQAARCIGPTRMLRLARLKFFAEYFVEIG